MSIVGLAIYALSLMCLIGFATPVDYDAAIGWGIIGMLYAVAFSIVSLVKATSNKKGKE